MSAGAAPRAGSTAVVVGGTSGIGAAVAEHFAGLGARVHAIGLNPAEAPPSLQSSAVLHDVDVTDGARLDEVVGGIARVDVLVNGAGIIRRDEEFRPDVFAQVLEVNLTAAMRASVAAYPALAAAGGCVVNVASMLSFFGGARVPAYTASKGGIAALTRSLAVAWGPAGVRVNAVAPGWIRTALTADLQDDPLAAGRILARTPLGRWGEPADVAGVIAFLAEPVAAAFITGAVIPVDGGYLAA